MLTSDDCVHKKHSMKQTKACPNKTKAGSILLLFKVAQSKKDEMHLCICPCTDTQCEQMANLEKNCSRNTNVLTDTKVKTRA